MADPGDLLGTLSKLTIFDDSGNIIVKEGEIITHGVIERARDAGRTDDLLMSAALSAHAESPEIRTAPEYKEIGEEEPRRTRSE